MPKEEHSLKCGNDGIQTCWMAAVMAVGNLWVVCNVLMGTEGRE